MQARKKDFTEEGIRIVAIASHSVEELAKQGRLKKIDFTLLADLELEVADRFGVRHAEGNPFGGDVFRPALFLLDEEGRVIERFVTDDWRVRPSVDRILEGFSKGR